MKRPVTILIVDDQAFVRKMMGTALTSLGGYAALEAADGMAAINLIRDQAQGGGAAHGRDLLETAARGTNRIDCIVSDINMLPMNGLEFVKAIRSGLAPIARDIPIIMLTGHTEKHFLAAAIALDVNGFLVKPVSAVTFRSRIERAMASPGALKPEGEYATLIVPEFDAKDLWSSAAAMGRAAAPIRAGDLAGGRQLPKRMDILDLKVGSRLAEDLRTDEGVLVAPAGSKVSPSLVVAIKDLSEIVTLRSRVAVFEG